MINGAALPLIIRKMKSTTTTTLLFTLVTLTVATSLLVQNGLAKKHHKTEDDKPEPNPMYPLKSFFMRTKGQFANSLTQELLRKGKYHNYLDIKQFRSSFCLGWDVILKVKVDDTTFFNAQTIWPKRPEVEWVEDALNQDLSWVTWIHFDSWGDDPYRDGEVFCPKQSVSIDLNDDDDDDDKDFPRRPTEDDDEDQQIDVMISADYTTATSKSQHKKNQRDKRWGN